MAAYLVGLVFLYRLNDISDYLCVFALVPLLGDVAAVAASVEAP